MPAKTLATSSHIVSISDMTPQEALELANLLVAYADGVDSLSAAEIGRQSVLAGRHNIGYPSN